MKTFVTRACFVSLTAAVVAATLFVARTQGFDRPDDEKSAAVDAATRAKVVEKLAEKLDKSYVFPEVGAKLKDALRSKLANNAYDSITTGPALARQLTDDLQAVSKDKHLRVSFSLRPPPGPGGGVPNAEMRKRMQEMRRKQNSGFAKVERLPGNIGLLELHNFVEGKDAEATAAAAMNFLADTDALIIDLRRNGGGSPRMVQVLCSYLLPAEEKVHLNTMFHRDRNLKEEYWTLKDLPGKRYTARDVYLLTSGRTFSAAEEFTYNLKNLKRATVVGETTGGGAHPGWMVPLGDHFAAFIPTGRAINPVTKTNWEGTGVKPDVEASADKALDVAREMAVKKLRETLTDPEAKELLEMDLRGPERRDRERAAR